MVSDTDESGSGVFVEFPLPEQRLFRNQAIEDILLLFVRNPHSEFTVTELRHVTEHGGDTVQTAIEVLEAARLIRTRTEGRRKLITANRSRIYNPGDPVLSIPQEEFRDPVNAFLTELEDVNIDIVGVILFGSVARGDADRASDIDLQVIVDHQLTEARRTLHDIRQRLENQTFDGQRYEFQLMIESIESAESYGDELQEIFSEGIVLEDSEALEEVREAVFHG